MDETINKLSNLTLNFKKLNYKDYIRSLKMQTITNYFSDLSNNPRETKKSICRRLNITTLLLNKYLKEFGLDKLCYNKKKKT